MQSQSTARVEATRSPGGGVSTPNADSVYLASLDDAALAAEVDEREGRFADATVLQLELSAQALERPMDEVRRRQSAQNDSSGGGE